jgi:hypothetical protein
MAIKYYLQPNPITPDPNDQSARVLSNEVFDVEKIIPYMLERGSTVTQADIRAVLDVFFAVTSDIVARGNSVNLPLVNIRPGINGVFASQTDNFDPSRHIKKASVSAGIMLNQKMQAAEVVKVLQPIAAPVLIEFTDVNTQTTNSILTPGGIGQLVGEELKFNPENTAEGIFLIPPTGAEIKVGILATRTEGKLVFGIPAGLASGNYGIQVRKGYGTTLLAVRLGSLQDSLTVS